MNPKLTVIGMTVAHHCRLLREVMHHRSGKPVLLNKFDAIIADDLMDSVQAAAGPYVADYFRLKFQDSHVFGKPEEYDVKVILTQIRDSLADCWLKKELTMNMDSLVAFTARLAELSPGKAVFPKKRKAEDPRQMLLFEEEKPEVEELPGAPAPKAKTRPKRKPGKLKLDRLADEIIKSEYGESGDDDQADRQCTSLEDLDYMADEI